MKTISSGAILGVIFPKFFNRFHSFIVLSSGSCTLLSSLSSPIEAAKRHSVHISGWRGVRRVQIGMRIDPDDAQAAIRLCDFNARDRSTGSAVVTADHHGKKIIFNRVFYCFDTRSYMVNTPPIRLA